MIGENVCKIFDSHSHLLRAHSFESIILFLCVCVYILFRERKRIQKFDYYYIQAGYGFFFVLPLRSFLHTVFLCVMCFIPLLLLSIRFTFYLPFVFCGFSPICSFFLLNIKVFDYYSYCVVCFVLHLF